MNRIAIFIATLLLSASVAEAQASVDVGRDGDGVVGETGQGASDEGGVSDEDSLDDAAPAFGAAASVERPLASTASLDATASGTEISTRHRVVAGEQPGELLIEIPGTVVRSTGALGAFTSVALRGAEFGQTTFLIGDIPLSGPDTGAFDLSLLPLSAFEALEVYRGGAPAWLNANAIGGVVRLRPRRSERGYGHAFGGELTYGSFGRFEADAYGELVGEAGQVTWSLGVDGAQNDFPYTFTNATTFDPTDDEERLRQNAQTLGAHGMLQGSWDIGDGRLSVLALGASRSGGVPSSGDSPALHTRRSELRALGAASYRHRFERGELSAVAGAGLQRHRFSDLHNGRGEIGLGQEQTDDRYRSVFGRIAGRYRPWEVLELTGVVAYRRDHFAPDNTVALDPDPSARNTLDASAEARLHGRGGPLRYELRGSVQLVHSATRAEGLRFGMAQTHSDTQTVPTYRVAGALSFWEPLAFSGSYSRGLRLPSMTELFGNRGALLAAPGLKPERGESWDVGLVLRGRRAWVRGQLELRYFDLSIENLIRYRTTSQYTAIAENVAEAFVHGVEAGGRGELGEHLSLSGAMTWLSTDSGRGKELNWRPPLQLQGRLELGTGSLLDAVKITAYASVVYRSAFFQDPANFVRVPGQSWVGAGAMVTLPRGFSVLVSARDLFDARGQDFLGFPLPGRRFAVTLRYRGELD